IRLLMRRDANKVNQLQREVPEVIQALAQIRHGEQMPESVQAAAPMAQVATVIIGHPEESAGPDVRSGSPSSILTDEYLLPPLDAEVLSYFAPEAQEYLESLEAQLLRLEKEQGNPDVINQLFRTAHTLKGSAYTVGFQSVGDLTHYIEDFMGAVRDGRIKILPGHADVLLRSVDVVRLLMRRDPMSLDMLRQRYAVAMQGLKQLDQPVAAQVMEPSSLVHPAEALLKQDLRDQQDVEPAKVGEGKTVEDREVIRVSRDRLERLLNLVGELVIGRGRLEQRLRVLEQLSQQVLACRVRLIDSVSSFEEKHTCTLPTSTGGTADPVKANSAAAAFQGVHDFGS